MRQVNEDNSSEHKSLCFGCIHPKSAAIISSLIAFLTTSTTAFLLALLFGHFEFMALTEGITLGAYIMFIYSFRSNGKKLFAQPFVILEAVLLLNYVASFVYSLHTTLSHSEEEDTKGAMRKEYREFFLFYTAAVIIVLCPCVYGMIYYLIYLDTISQPATTQQRVATVTPDEELDGGHQNAAVCDPPPPYSLVVHDSFSNDVKNLSATNIIMRGRECGQNPPTYAEIVSENTSGPQSRVS